MLCIVVAYLWYLPYSLLTHSPTTHSFARVVPIPRRCLTPSKTEHEPYLLHKYSKIIFATAARLRTSAALFVRQRGVGPRPCSYTTVRGIYCTKYLLYLLLTVSSDRRPRADTLYVVYLCVKQRIMCVCRCRNFIPRPSPDIGEGENVQSRRIPTYPKVRTYLGKIFVFLGR
ncbi:hypothetical protein GGS21DRAFT_474254 [Xylaria nigripes]|nr:hypothetical protein GGS21DRAFT_474254 [Xylaria nigripes]